MEQKYMIYTERGWKVQIREKILSVGQMDIIRMKCNRITELAKIQ